MDWRQNLHSKNHPKLAPNLYNGFVKFTKFCETSWQLSRKVFRYFSPSTSKFFPSSQPLSSPLLRKISTYRVFCFKNNFFVLYHDYCVFCKDYFLFKLTLLYFYQKPIQIRTSRSSCFLSVFPHALLFNGSTLTFLQYYYIS